MINPKGHYRIRRLHRWLGFILGIQFLMWTIGGLYFSWSDMDEVHGDYDVAHAELIPNQTLVSPSIFLDSLKTIGAFDSLVDLKLITILDIPHWQAICHPRGHHHRNLVYLWNAETGTYRPALEEEVAIEIARKRYLGNGQVKLVTYITETGKHHEYREQPLPAFAVTFEDSHRTTVYVASELGVITKVRNRPWRRFDFLWMLHTMDYTSRDNITNWLLKAFSIFGLATVASGFTLFFVSRKKRPTSKTKS